MQPKKIVWKNVGEILIVSEKITTRTQGRCMMMVMSIEVISRGSCINKNSTLLQMIAFSAKFLFFLSENLLSFSSAVLYNALIYLFFTSLFFSLSFHHFIFQIIS